MKEKILNSAKKLVTRRNTLISVALLIFWFAITRNAQNTKQITLASVEKKPIAQTVSASGVIRSENQVDLKFQTSGKIAYINANQGDQVKKYQLIASLDPQQLQKKLKEDLNLYFKQRLDFDVNDKNKNVNDDLKRIAQKSQADLDNTVLDVEIADLAIKYANIYSPIDGYITTNPKTLVGTNVLTTDTIATVADLSALEFASQIDETEIGQIIQGQKSEISLDAFPEDKISASVERISPVSVTTSTGSTAFEAVFALSQDTSYKIGMNGTAVIQIRKVESALVIPQEAIQDDGSVWVKTGKNYQKRSIKKGIESDTETEITDGLTKNDQVVIVGFDQLQKGSILQKIVKKL